MWILRQILSDQSLLQRAAIDFKSGDLRKKPRLNPFSSWTLSLMFVFSSPLSSTFANVIVKELFLGHLRKRSRWNVKQRNCVQLIFSYQIRTGHKSGLGTKICKIVEEMSEIIEPKVGNPKNSVSRNWAILSDPWNLTIFDDDFFQLFS